MLRVLISVDMEGIAGVVDPEDVQPGHPEYERNRVLMTAEASAAVRGVIAADPDAHVLVTDAHASFRNLLPDQLDRRAELIRGKPKPDGMLAGLDQNADATIFIGYHGQAGTFRSVLAHTINGGVIADVRCNGRSHGELGLNAALAASSGAPAVLVAGDDTVAAEAADVAPGMRTVVVKRALGGTAAISLHPAEACDRIEQQVPEALAIRATVEAPQFDGGLELEVEVFRPRQAERALLVPGVQLVGNGRTVRYAAADIRAAYQMVQLISILGSG